MGARTLPAQVACFRQQNGLAANRYLLLDVPAWPSDPICRSCPSHVTVSTACSKADPAIRGSIGSYFRLHFRNNVMVERVQWAALRECFKRNPIW